MNKKMKVSVVLTFQGKGHLKFAIVSSFYVSLEWCEALSFIVVSVSCDFLCVSISFCLLYEYNLSFPSAVTADTADGRQASLTADSR
jgi:hypothetical protein